MPDLKADRIFPCELLLDTIRSAVREEIKATIADLGSKGESKGPLQTFLTVEELSKVLKVPKSWIYERTRRKKDSIPHIKAGRYPRFELSQVLDWLESQKNNELSGLSVLSKGTSKRRGN